MSPDDTAVSTSTRDADTDDRSEMLSDPYTRSLIEYLRDAGGESSLRPLARGVASSVTGENVDDVDAVICRQVETFLHHGQLPELAKHGIVDYDADENYVVLLVEDI